ncbi:hypothetical protein TorRG33x02_107790 [Trema orientale]|uniref:Uncharacterized protein n=1 Tax=Trema orientale TaxID=63057 RepID=A0A2P5F6T5_TREOI|nr:hypothetical protein TorRG33x02_107790 [Trema orientale]
MAVTPLSSLGFISLSPMCIPPKWSDLQYKQLSYVKVTFSPVKEAFSQGLKTRMNPFTSHIARSRTNLQINHQFLALYLLESAFALPLGVFLAPFLLFLPESPKIL